MSRSNALTLTLASFAVLVLAMSPTDAQATDQAKLSASTVAKTHVKAAASRQGKRAKAGNSVAVAPAAAKASAHPLDLDIPLLADRDGAVRHDIDPLPRAGLLAEDPGGSLERWYKEAVTNSGTRIVATLSSGDLIPRTALGPSPLSTPFQTIATVDADRASRLSSSSTASVDRPTDKTQTINTAIAVPVAPGIRLGIGLDADLSRSSPDIIPTFGIARRF